MMEFYYYSQIFNQKGTVEFKSNDGNMQVKIELSEDVSRKIRAIIEDYARTQHAALREQVTTIGTDHQLTAPDNDESDKSDKSDELSEDDHPDTSPDVSDAVDVECETVISPADEDYPF